MRIKKITRQHKQEFWADYQCEYCGFISNHKGYDDRNYHEKVAPLIACPNCERKTGETQ